MRPSDVTASALAAEEPLVSKVERGRMIDVAKVSTTTSPLPLAGEGQGGGMHARTSKSAPSPPIPRKRGREQAEFAATAVPQALAHSLMTCVAVLIAAHLSLPALATEI